jgi:hypothetical protein
MTTGPTARQKQFWNAGAIPRQLTFLQSLYQAYQCQPTAPGDTCVELLWPPDAHT